MGGCRGLGQNIRGDTIFSLILASLRGFCLFIAKKHAVGISAKKTAQIPYPALSRFGMSDIYELCELGVLFRR